MGELLEDELELDRLNDGVFIMFHRKSDDYPLAVKPDKWASYQNSGEIADGVLVVDGGKMLVVAPTEDWTGKTSTAAQITHNECKTESYAPGFCASYERVNANGQGLTAGKWWLPSLGEMMMIYANMSKINYALSLINGATQLAGTAYWSSTESSATSAWHLSLNIGLARTYSKSLSQCRVRPVSAF